MTPSLAHGDGSLRRAVPNGRGRGLCIYSIAYGGGGGLNEGDVVTAQEDAAEGLHLVRVRV